jgi:hypothetical protein
VCLPQVRGQDEGFGFSTAVTDSYLNDKAGFDDLDASVRTHCVGYMM